MAVAPTVTEDPLNALIDGTLQQLDITQEMHQSAVAEYQRVALHLSAAGAADGIDVYVHPQGSFLLGTGVLPMGRDQFDIDLVCRYNLVSAQTTRPLLKQRAGAALGEYLSLTKGDPTGPTDLKECARAWTLLYTQRFFHLDVLPAIRDDGASSPTAILLPDRDLAHWQHSDPLGFAAWFVQRTQPAMVLKAAEAYVAGVPHYTVRTVLHRIVQVLKRHRDLYFRDDMDNRPPSILLTTLAALAYEGNTNIYSGVIDVANHVYDYIESRAGVWWLPNPVAESENFVDKWNKHHVRRMRFDAWLGSLVAEVEVVRKQNLAMATKQLQGLFGEEPVNKAAARVGTEYRELRGRGALSIGGPAATLTTGVGTRVREHTFYGTR